MNERIKELVRESNLDVYGLGKERYKWEYTVAKFAELIAQECALELSRVPGGFDGPLFYKNSKLLKEHFGVEE